MSSYQSTTDKVSQQREIARQELPPVRYDMSLLRKALNTPANMNAGENLKSVFEEDTDDGNGGEGASWWSFWRWYF
ncbi:hypothetical protein ACHAPU_002639 [Fusarium lateritium]